MRNLIKKILIDLSNEYLIANHRNYKIMTIKLQRYIQILQQILENF